MGKREYSGRSITERNRHRDATLHPTRAEDRKDEGVVESLNVGERWESEVGVASSDGEHMRSGGILQSGISSRSISFPGIALRPTPRVAQSTGAR